VKWQKAHGVLSTGNFGGMSRAKYLDLQEQKVGKRAGGRRGFFGGRKKQEKKAKQEPAAPTAARQRGSEGTSIRTKSRSFEASRPTRQVVSVAAPQARKAKKGGFSWGTSLVFFVTLVVCWQTLSVYYRRQEQRAIERERNERDRAVQISRWMRTIDTDRNA